MRRVRRKLHRVSANLWRIEGHSDKGFLDLLAEIERVGKLPAYTITGSDEGMQATVSVDEAEGVWTIEQDSQIIIFDLEMLNAFMALACAYAEGHGGRLVPEGAKA